MHVAQYIQRIKFHLLVEKGTPTQNVMSLCSFNIQFIFVVVIWEGIAYARVIPTIIANSAFNFPNHSQDLHL